MSSLILIIILISDFFTESYTYPDSPASAYQQTTNDSLSLPGSFLKTQRQCPSTPIAYSQPEPPTFPLLWTPPERSFRIALNHLRPPVPGPRPSPVFFRPIELMFSPSIPNPASSPSSCSNLYLPAVQVEDVSQPACVAGRRATDTAGEDLSSAHSDSAGSTIRCKQNTSILNLCWAP
jgi:hypothetical protein